MTSGRALAQRVDDGHQTTARRRSRIEQLVARRRFGQSAQLHQGTYVLATRQPVKRGVTTSGKAAGAVQVTVTWFDVWVC